MGPLLWPTSPILWDGGIGTWNIGLWADMPLNWLALDIPGATLLGFDLVDASGTLIASSTAIDAAMLSTFSSASWMGGLWPAYGMLPWMNGLSSVGFFGAPSYVFGLGFFPSVGGVGLPGVGLSGIGGVGINNLAFPGLLPAGLATTGVGTTALLPSAAFLTPTLTSSALWLNTMPFIGADPLFLNVRFSGLTASSMASLNIMSSFTAMSAQTASIQATLFPIMGIPLIL
jgi:hypothetical protein